MHLRLTVHLWLAVNLWLVVHLWLAVHLWSIVNRSIATHDRPRRRRHRRTPMIHIGESIAVLTRNLLMLRLHRSRGHMPITHRRLLRRIRPCLCPVRTTVIARTARIVMDHRTIDIGIVDHRGIDPRDRRVVTEMSADPFPAAITYTVITMAIVDPAIKTYMRTPITGMPVIDPAGPAPITRCP